VTNLPAGSFHAVASICIGGPEFFMTTVGRKEELTRKEQRKGFGSQDEIGILTAIGEQVSEPQYVSLVLLI